MRSGLRQVLKVFHELPKAGQNSPQSDLPKISIAIALMIEDRLTGQADFGDRTAKMERETLRKSSKVLLPLEQLACRGFTEFLGEFGGGPDNNDYTGPAHLVKYLQLVKDNMNSYDAQVKFEEVRQYIKRKNNMIQDYNFDAFESFICIKC